MKHDKYTGKSIFITGASSGIGAALAENLAAQETQLFLCGRNQQRLEEVAQKCRNKGAKTEIFIFDVTSKEAAKEAVIKANNIQKIDLLIANAGVSSGALGISEDTLSTRAILETNIFGVVNTVLPMIEVMRQNNGGQIALMSSMAGYRGLRNCPAYSASKNFVKAWGEALRGFLEKDCIRVSVICPGFIKTPLTDANTFKMPLLMPASQAAKIIVKDLKKNKPIIAFPALLTFAAWIGAVLPSWIFYPLLKLLPQKEK